MQGITTCDAQKFPDYTLWRSLLFLLSASVLLVGRLCVWQGNFNLSCSFSFDMSLSKLIMSLSLDLSAVGYLFIVAVLSAGLPLSDFSFCLPLFAWHFSATKSQFGSRPKKKKKVDNLGHEKDFLFIYECVLTKFLVDCRTCFWVIFSPLVVSICILRAENENDYHLFSLSSG